MAKLHEGKTTAMTRLILLAMVAWLVGGATASAESSQVLVTYVSKGRAHFTIAIPDDWRMRTGFEVDPTAMPDGRGQSGL